MLNLNVYVVTTYNPGNTVSDQTTRVLAESPAEAVETAKADPNLYQDDKTMFLAAIDRSYAN